MVPSPYSGFAVTSGARLIDSTPPAMKSSPSPAATAWQAETTADNPEAQRRVWGDPPAPPGGAAGKTAHGPPLWGCPPPPGSARRGSGPDLAGGSAPRR